MFRKMNKYEEDYRFTITDGIKTIKLESENKKYEYESHDFFLTDMSVINDFVYEWFNDGLEGTINEEESNDGFLSIFKYPKIVLKIYPYRYVESLSDISLTIVFKYYGTISVDNSIENRLFDLQKWVLVEEFEYPEWDGFEEFKSLSIAKYFFHNEILYSLKKYHIPNKKEFILYFGSIGKLKFVPFSRQDKRSGDNPNIPKYKVLKKYDDICCSWWLRKFVPLSRMMFPGENNKAPLKLADIARIEKRIDIEQWYFSRDFINYVSTLYIGWCMINWEICSLYDTKIVIDWKTGKITIYRDNGSRKLGNRVVVNGKYSFFSLRKYEIEHYYGNICIDSVFDFYNSAS